MGASRPSGTGVVVGSGIGELRRLCRRCGRWVRRGCRLSGVGAAIAAGVAVGSGAGVGSEQAVSIARVNRMMRVARSGRCT